MKETVIEKNSRVIHKFVELFVNLNLAIQAQSSKKMLLLNPSKYKRQWTNQLVMEKK